MTFGEIWVNGIIQPLCFGLSLLIHTLKLASIAENALNRLKDDSRVLNSQLRQLTGN